MPRRSMSTDSPTSSILGISGQDFDGCCERNRHTNRARQLQSVGKCFAAAVGLAAGNYAKATITDCLSSDGVAKALCTASPSR